MSDVQTLNFHVHLAQTAYPTCEEHRGRFEVQIPYAIVSIESFDCICTASDLRSDLRHPLLHSSVQENEEWNERWDSSRAMPLLLLCIVRTLCLVLGTYIGSSQTLLDRGSGEFVISAQDPQINQQVHSYMHYVQ